jgi:hypothetical protein
MSQNILQGYVAVEVNKSDNANIPFPATVVVGVSDSITANQLIATGSTDFVAAGVKIGDIVYNETEGTAATVLDVLDPQILLLNADIFQLVGGGEDFIIGKSGNLKVTTIAGQTVTFVALPIGFFPVQVKKVWGKNGDAGMADNIIALW